MYLIKCLLIGWVASLTLLVIIILVERIDDKFGQGFCLFWSLVSVIATIIGAVILEINNL